MAVAGREVLAQHLYQRHVEQAIEQRLLPGLVAQHLAAEQVHRRAQGAPRLGTQAEGRRQRFERRSAEIALEVVGAAEEHGRRAIARDDAAPAGRVQRQVGERDARGSGLVGHLVARRLPHEHDVAGHEPEGLRGSVGPEVRLARDHGVHGDARPRGEAHPPIVAHRCVGECGSAGAGTLEKVRQNIHGKDDRTWIWRFKHGITPSALYWILHQPRRTRCHRRCASIGTAESTSSTSSTWSRRPPARARCSCA